MDGSGDRVDEALIGVGGEIDRDLDAWRDGADHLDVEHDLGVSAIRSGRLIAPVIDRDGDDRRHLQAELLEVGLQVGGAEATPELNDAHALTLAGGAAREVVELTDLDRRKRRTRLLGQDFNAFELGEAPQVRPGRGSIVEPEHPLNDVRQSGGNVDRALAAAEGAPVGVGVRG